MLSVKIKNTIFKNPILTASGTFGYGNDHDSELMTWISDKKDGNFYFIEDVKKVGVCFIDCLG